MIFDLMFKTPDVMDQLEINDPDKREAAEKFLEEFIEYREYIRVRFDTEASTATVERLTV